jgi:hypothetical protein
VLRRGKDAGGPLFLLKDENQRINFDAKITEDNLNGFINSVLQ